MLPCALFLEIIINWGWLSYISKAVPEFESTILHPLLSAMKQYRVRCSGHKVAIYVCHLVLLLLQVSGLHSQLYIE